MDHSLWGKAGESSICYNCPPGNPGMCTQRNLYGVILMGGRDKRIPKARCLASLADQWTPGSARGPVAQKICEEHGKKDTRHWCLASIQKQICAHAQEHTTCTHAHTYTPYNVLNKFTVLCCITFVAVVNSMLPHVAWKPWVGHVCEYGQHLK